MIRVVFLKGGCLIETGSEWGKGKRSHCLIAHLFFDIPAI